MRFTLPVFLFCFSVFAGEYDSVLSGIRSDIDDVKDSVDAINSDFYPYVTSIDSDLSDALIYLSSLDTLSGYLHTDVASIASEALTTRQLATQINTYLRQTINTKLQNIINAVNSSDANQTANWSLWLNHWLAFERLYQGASFNITNALNSLVDTLDDFKGSSFAVNVTNSVAIRALDELRVSVTNPVALATNDALRVLIDIDNANNDNALAGLLQDIASALTGAIASNATSVAASVSNALSSVSLGANFSISNLVDSWASIYQVPGWNPQGVNLSLEAFLSEWLSEWNRSFYNQSDSIRIVPPFTGQYTLLNWWGTAGLNPDEANARYAFSDWVADAFRFFVVNASNMVVESFEPYTTSQDLAGNNQYEPDWKTNLNKSAYSRPELEAVDTTEVETDLASLDSNFDEAFGKIDTSSMSGSTSVRIIPHMEVGGIEVEEKRFDFSENSVASSYALSVGRVMVLVWNVIGLCIAFKMFNDFWRAFTQL